MNFNTRNKFLVGGMIIALAAFLRWGDIPIAHVFGQVSETELSDSELVTKLFAEIQGHIPNDAKQVMCYPQTDEKTHQPVFLCHVKVVDKIERYVTVAYTMNASDELLHRAYNAKLAFKVTNENGRQPVSLKVNAKVITAQDAAKAMVALTAPVQSKIAEAVESAQKAMSPEERNLETWNK